MTDYITISFGPSEDVARLGWWNRKERFYDLEEAKQNGRQQLSNPGTFGFIIIEDMEDEWDVVYEMGSPANAVSISCNRLGTFKVEPASKLQLL
jgi:hypothetical protein